MFKLIKRNHSAKINKLAIHNYWPAIAYGYLNQGLYSKTVELCRKRLDQNPELLSGRIIYARALYYAGQLDSAAEQFQKILSTDPTNMTALKYLGDIKFVDKNELGAMACYEKILQLDPLSTILKSAIDKKHSEKTRTITLKRKKDEKTTKQPLRPIPFYTETMGDLYMTQGFPRMAAEVYNRLSQNDSDHRLLDKIAKAEMKIKEKEQSHVKKTD